MGEYPGYQLPGAEGQVFGVWDEDLTPLPGHRIVHRYPDCDGRLALHQLELSLELLQDFFRNGRGKNGDPSSEV